MVNLTKLKRCAVKKIAAEETGILHGNGMLYLTFLDEFTYILCNRYILSAISRYEFITPKKLKIEMDYEYRPDEETFLECDGKKYEVHIWMTNYQETILSRPSSMPYPNEKIQIRGVISDAKNREYLRTQLISNLNTLIGMWANTEWRSLAKAIAISNTLKFSLIGVNREVDKLKGVASSLLSGD